MVFFLSKTPPFGLLLAQIFYFSSLALLIKSNALIGERVVDHFSEETDSCLVASVNFGQGKYS